MSDTRTYTREDADAMLGALPATSAGQQALCPEGFVNHILQTGETLRSVAQAYGLSLNELLLYNPSANPFYYKTGDNLCVPAVASAASAAVDAGTETAGELVVDDFSASEQEGAQEDGTAAPGTGPEALPTPALPDNTPAAPGPGPVELPTPALPDNTPAAPGPGPVALPTPALPENTPAAPGPGPVELPTPALPDNTPAAPGPGPVELPTPALPGNGQGSSTAPIPSCPSGRYYRVSSGDTLRSIASRFGLTLEALMEANPGVTNNRLLVGQLLCLPACCTSVVCVTRVRVPSGATFADFLTRYNVSYASLAAVNPGVNLLSLRAGQVLCVPPEGSRGPCGENGSDYLVQEGENLQSLASANNLSAGELLLANPNLAPLDFTAGRLVCIPSL